MCHMKNSSLNICCKLIQIFANKTGQRKSNKLYDFPNEGFEATSMTFCLSGMWRYKLLRLLQRIRS